jgi:hypothetical protein
VVVVFAGRIMFSASQVMRRRPRQQERHEPVVGKGRNGAVPWSSHVK